MSISYPEAVASRLCALAASSGLPRRGLAPRLSEICDVSIHASHKWVTGLSAPSRTNAAKIANAFGTTVAYLLLGDTTGDQEAKAAQIPMPIYAVALLHQSGEIDDEDLKEVERFARLLATKNRGAMRTCPPQN